MHVTAQQLEKSRGTVWKYLSIYKKLIQGHPDAFAELKQCDHPILGRIEDLLEVAQSDDILDGCPGWTMSELEMTPCQHCRYEAYPIVVTAQVVKTRITLRLATADRLQEAEMEPLHPVGQLHMRR